MRKFSVFVIVGAAAALVLSLAFCGTASAGTVDFISPDAPVGIPDGTDTFDVWQEINIPAGTGPVLDLDVDLMIEHTWQGDLNVEIEHLSTGTRVSLLHRAGDSAEGGLGFQADNFGDFASGATFVLDDEAAAAYDSSLGWGTIADPGIASVTGSWIPFGMFPGGGIGGLTAFDGEDSAGLWRLYVSDNAGADTGTLAQFSMHVTVPEPASLLLLALGGLVARRRR